MIGRSRKNYILCFFLIAVLSVCLSAYYWSWTNDIFAECKCSYINRGIAKAIANCEGHKELRNAIANELHLVMKNIIKARRYARSGKTLKELQNAHMSLEKLIYGVDMQFIKNDVRDELKQEFDKEQNGKKTSYMSNRSARDIANVKNIDRENKNGNLPLVCPEIFNGTKAGYFLYKEGWHRTYCTTSLPFNKVVTIILYPQNSNRNKIATMLNDISTSYPSLTAIVAVDETKNSPSPEYLKSLNLKVKIIDASSDKPGAVWNRLIAKVATPYVFVGRDIERFTYHARLKRQVDVAHKFDIDIVGGSYRTPNGHWSYSCRQFAMQNYTLAYIEGYDMSKDSCLFCEHLNAPFVAKTDVLKDLFPFDEKLPGGVIFEDLFIRIKRKNRLVMSCPDSMFFVQDSQSKKEFKEAWTPLIIKWELNRIHLTSGTVLRFSCEESQIKCDAVQYKTLALPICCMEYLSRGMNLLMKVCDDFNIWCETDTGNTIGSVKLNGILPWERDGDIMYSYFNHSILRKTVDIFAKAGFELKEEKQPSENGWGGYYELNVPGWRIELWGMPVLGSEELIDQGLNITRISTDGYWHQSPPNPGLYVRNRYGKEIYKHVQHWQIMGEKDSWVDYNPGSYISCSKPAHHGCLNNYLGDGNIQFMGPWL